jgi:hypothetical protein
MISLSWNQVSAWRLARHGLLERAPRDRLLDAVSRLGGAHAQLMSAAELILWARVEQLRSDDVQRALWQDRTLVKTWAMRGTLHLVSVADFPLYVAALSTRSHYRRGSWLKYHGVTLDEIEAILAGVQQTLSGDGLTREQLADQLAERTATPKLAELLRSGWGALLKPAAFQGLLCFGPSQGQQVTFVRPSDWIGPWQAPEPQRALATIARRFLATYGPATIDEFARWLGLEQSDARRVFRALGDEVVAVDVEGWSASALRSDIAELETASAPPTVRLLPHFDPYTLAIARHSSYLLPEAHKGRVYRPQGWISPVVLIDGRIAGVWEHDKQRAATALTVDLFAPPDAAIERGVAAEAERLGAFLDSAVSVTYADSR